MIKKITEEEMQQYNGCTVGDLLKFVQDNNISLDSKIFIERVEDVYFEKHEWAIVEKEQYFTAPPEKHEYHIAWSPVKYEGNKLFIDLHY